jgi:Tol biopolymer transport system component
VFSSQIDPRERQPNLYWLHADGSGVVQRLTTSPNGQTPGSWHPSGRILAFTEHASHLTVMLLPMEGDERSGWKPGKPTVFQSDAFDQREPAFSPDGRWLAYESNQSGRYNVLVRPYPGPGPQTTISTSGGEAPIWSRTRSELLYGTRDRGVMVVNYSVDGGSFRAGQPRPWPESLLRSGLNVRSFALHPDGNRLALPAAGETAPATGWERFDVALNFFDELRRIAPIQTR